MESIISKVHEIALILNEVDGIAEKRGSWSLTPLMIDRVECIKGAINSTADELGIPREHKPGYYHPGPGKPRILPMNDPQSCLGFPACLLPPLGENAAIDIGWIVYRKRHCDLIGNDGESAGAQGISIFLSRNAQEHRFALYDSSGANFVHVLQWFMKPRGLNLAPVLPMPYFDLWIDTIIINLREILERKQKLEVGNDRTMPLQKYLVAKLGSGLATLLCADDCPRLARNGRVSPRTLIMIQNSSLPTGVPAPIQFTFIMQCWKKALKYFQRDYCNSSFRLTQAVVDFMCDPPAAGIDDGLQSFKTAMRDYLLTLPECILCSISGLTHSRTADIIERDYEDLIKAPLTTPLTTSCHQPSPSEPATTSQ